MYSILNNVPNIPFVHFWASLLPRLLIPCLRVGLGTSTSDVFSEGQLLFMAVASDPAGPGLNGPVFTFAFNIVHAQTINNWQ